MLRSGERIQSPIEKGRSRKIIKPPKKLASKSFAAKPTAMPPIPPKARIAEILNPRLCRPTSTEVIITEIRNNWLTASVVVLSTCLPFIS